MSAPPEPGATAKIETIVTASMTASQAARDHGERYPDVLGTPFLVQEMERAAALLLRPYLDAGQVSVGVQVDMAHLGPTSVGALLRSHARLTGREGRLFWFEVWSEDPAGIVGRGRHSRAILDVAAIENKAKTRRVASPE